jgi:hypothetical protein
VKAKKIHYGESSQASEPMMLNEQMLPCTARDSGTGAMVRTQIYLSQNEHEFLLTAASRSGKSMAAVIRSFIDEKMAPPADAWENNPLLDAPRDSKFIGPEDGVINHDHYVYGSPKKWVKKGVNWEPAPTLPEDYYTNEKSRETYDRLTGKVP